MDSIHASHLPLIQVNVAGVGSGFPDRSWLSEDHYLRSSRCLSAALARLTISLLMKSSKAGSNHFFGSITFSQYSPNAPNSKALLIHRIHPSHSLSLSTFL